MRFFVQTSQYLLREVNGSLLSRKTKFHVCVTDIMCVADSKHGMEKGCFMFFGFKKRKWLSQSFQYTVCL